MSRVHSSAYEKVNVSGFLEKHTADHGCTVTVETPFLVLFIASQDVLCVFNNLVYGYDPFRNKIYSFDLGNGGNVAAFKLQACFQRFSEIFRSY